jgi:hypothetical protein
MAIPKKRKTSSFKWSPERRARFNAKKAAKNFQPPLPRLGVMPEKIEGQSYDDFDTNAAIRAHHQRMMEHDKMMSNAVQGETKFYSHIDNPIGYTKGRIEVIDFIEDKNLNLHLGSAVQYIVRSSYKGGRDDLRKAIWYLQREIYRQEREMR